MATRHVRPHRMRRLRTELRDRRRRRHARRHQRAVPLVRRGHLAALAAPDAPRPRAPAPRCRSQRATPACRGRRRRASRSPGGRRPAARRSPWPPARSPLSRLRPRAPGLAAAGARRGVAAALGDQRVGHRRERLELAHDAVAAAMRARAARAAADRVARDAQRELELERLDGRVERVRHRDVDAARAVGVRAGALAAAERLVVREASSRSVPRVRLFIVPWPSARPKAASTRSATRLEVSTLPPATAAGERAFSSEPSGASTSIGR